MILSGSFRPPTFSRVEYPPLQWSFLTLRSFGDIRTECIVHTSRSSLSREKPFLRISGSELAWAQYYSCYNSTNNLL